jgi:hypothetical protein
MDTAKTFVVRGVLNHTAGGHPAKNALEAGVDEHSRKGLYKSSTRGEFRERLTCVKPV